MMTIGYANRTRYWQKYAFDNPPEGIEYKRAIDIPFYLTGIKNQFIKHTKWMVPFQNCDMYHTYNSIVAGRKPWIVEVESTIPRYGNMDESSTFYKWGINRLRSDQCRAIIFTSECTKKMNRKNFRNWDIDENKCHVVYRAVETYKPLERAGEDIKFTILMVGNAFYRKGGVELLKAFERFSPDDVRLVIISNFEVDWRINPSREETEYVEDIVKNNPKIEVFSNLPHKEVITWMRKSDVFVSTTFADPFNNTILEALACSLPAITSNERAIPEFVSDGYNGFVLEIEEADQETIVNFILKHLNKYYNDSALLSEHRKNALDMIETKFLIDHRNRRLQEILNNSFL